jgi:hypothetical protein
VRRAREVTGMPYATHASIRPGADRARLVRLVETLCAYGCVVRVERRERTVVLELPEDDFEWIVTGGLAELIGSFDDWLEWEPHFRERAALARHGLPAPRRRPVR